MQERYSCDDGGEMNIKEARIVAQPLRQVYSLDQLRQKFISYELDAQFREIGAVCLKGRKVADHIFIWTGFEVVTESKWLYEK